MKGLRGEESITDLCRREGLHPILYYKRNKAFLEAGKRQLTGATVRGAGSEEVREIRVENEVLKQLVTEISLKNRILKKIEGFGTRVDRYMRYIQLCARCFSYDKLIPEHQRMKIVEILPN